MNLNHASLGEFQACSLRPPQTLFLVLRFPTSWTDLVLVTHVPSLKVAIVELFLPKTICAHTMNPIRTVCMPLVLFLWKTAHNFWQGKTVNPMKTFQLTLLKLYKRVDVDQYFIQYSKIKLESSCKYMICNCTTFRDLDMCIPGFGPGLLNTMRCKQLKQSRQTGFLSELYTWRLPER